MSEPAATVTTAAPDTGGGAPSAPQSTRDAAMEYITASMSDAADGAIAATGGATPAHTPAVPGQPPAAGQEPPGPVPYERFQEVVRARQELEQQFGQFQPYQPLVTALSEAGLSPDQVFDLLSQQPDAQQAGTAPYGQAPGQPGQPDAFDQELLSRGIDPQFVDATTYNLARFQWEQAQQVQGWMQSHEQRVEQQERQGIQVELTTAMQQAKQAHTLLQDPEMERLAYAQFSFDAERGIPFEQSVAGFAQRIEGLVQGRLATYAAGKQADSAVPVTAGGSAPPPLERPDFNRMSAEQRRQAVMDHLVSSAGSG